MKHIVSPHLHLFQIIERVGPARIRRLLWGQALEPSAIAGCEADSPLAFTFQRHTGYVECPFLWTYAAVKGTQGGANGVPQACAELGNHAAVSRGLYQDPPAECLLQGDAPAPAGRSEMPRCVARDIS